MINNADILRPLLKFPGEHPFYFLEVIKRRKENPEMATGQSTLKDYYLHSLEDFDKLLPKVIEHCNENNARAYLRLNVRNAEKIAWNFNRAVVEQIINRQFNKLPKLYASVAGQHQHEEKDEKKWLIDLDDEQAEPKFYTPLLNEIVKLRSNAIVALVPTLNGLHIITRTFNLQEFWKVAMHRADLPQNLDIKKDAMTILYAP